MNLSTKLMLTSSVSLALLIGVSRPHLQAYFLSASAAIAAGSTTKMVCDRKLKILTSQLTAAGQNLHQSIQDFDECKALLAVSQLSLDKAKKESEYSSHLASNLTSENNNYQSQIDNLNHELSGLRLRLIEAQKQLEHQQYINLEWQDQFQIKVSDTANKLLLQAKKHELENIYREHDSISNEAINLFSRLQSYVEKINSSHDSKSQIIKSLATNYNENIDSINSQIDNERGQYLQQIEALNERVGLLQSQLHGDLLSPIYPENSFNEVARVASAIIKLIWINYNIPLEFCGFDADSFGVKVGNQDVSHLANFLNSKCQEIAKTLGIFEVSFKQLAIAPIIQVRVKTSRPVVKTDKSSLIRSQSDFLKFIEAQPIRFRIVGSPGAGKTPTSLIIMNHLLVNGFKSGNMPSGQKLDYSIIEYCNPLSSSSVKNSQDLLLFEKWTDAQLGVHGLKTEYDGRKNNLNWKEYKNRSGYIWVLDESDNALADHPDGSAIIKAAIKDGGHVNIGLIMMAQSAMISAAGRGKNGFSVDDQKMFCNIFLDANSIRSFLGNYGEKFYSRKTIDAALNNLDQIEILADSENESIGDSARRFRFAMATGDRSPIFFQLPFFDSQIDAAKYSAAAAAAAALKSPEVLVCSHCGSRDFKKNGVYNGKQRYKCTSCGRSFT